MASNLESLYNGFPMQELKEKTTDKAPLEEIRQWVSGKPGWIQFVFEKIQSKNDLNDDDYKDILSIAKKEKEWTPSPISEGFDRKGAGQKNVNLKAIKNVQDVNALAKEQCLSFSDKPGLTVVYGNNGSGKSGYARILKSVCRARVDKDFSVRPNVYNKNSKEPSAEIEYSVNGEPVSYKWVQGGRELTDLPEVSVFDSSTASVHLNKDHDIAYIPFPLKLLSRLTEVVFEIKSRLQYEKTEIEEQTPEFIKNPPCSQNGDVWNYLNSLNKNTDLVCLEDLCDFSPEDEKELTQLKNDSSVDRKMQVEKLENQRQQLLKIQEALKKIEEIVTQKNLEKIQFLHDDLANKKEASKAVAENLDSDLEGVGSDVWKILWNSARNYSEKQAYQGNKFPHIGEESHCVLCHQPLSSDAKDRLVTLNEFVQNDLNKAVEKAEESFKASIEEARNCFPNKERIKDLAFILDDSNVSDLSNLFKKSVVNAKKRLHQFKLRKYKLSTSLAPVDFAVLEKLKLESTELEERLKNLSSSDARAADEKMKKKKASLEDRKWIKSVKKDVENEVFRRIKINELESLIKETNTQSITKKSTELSKKLVTDTLRLRFSKEASNLNIGKIGIELQQSGSKAGSPNYAVLLVGNPKEKNIGSVLSEGEHRCIALAAFLAEQATTNNKSALVLDDPVCSLDHEFREAVVNRLVEEARDRQVIIFTHDLYFFYLIDSLCRDKKIRLDSRWILKTNDSIGLCQPRPPYKLLPVRKAIEAIREDFENKKRLFENNNHTEWVEQSEGIYKNMRDLWERAVEDVISPVLRRFHKKVNTGGLSLVSVLNREDCEVVTEAFAHCSSLSHSQGDAAHLLIIKPIQIEEDIQRLSDWYSDIKERQKNKNLN